MWAVGDVYPFGLIKHWDGKTWSRVSGATDFSRVTLDAVSVLAADDAWLVGSVSGVRDSTLIEHWDGMSWSVIPSPNANEQDNVLNGISAVSPTDIWAVGSNRSRGKSHTMTEHRDGTAWTIISGDR